jgi:hypothetical protein
MYTASTRETPLEHYKVGDDCLESSTSFFVSCRRHPARKARSCHKAVLDHHEPLLQITSVVQTSPFPNHSVLDLPYAFSLDFHHIAILQPSRRVVECSHTTVKLSLRHYFYNGETTLGVPVMIAVPFLSIMPRLKWLIIFSMLRMTCPSKPLARMYIRRGKSLV